MVFSKHNTYDATAKDVPVWVRIVVYLSILQVPFTYVHIFWWPGHSVQSITEVIVLITALVYFPICLRYLPAALLAFIVFLALRVFWGIVMAPEIAPYWWATSRNLFRLVLWAWFLIGPFQSPRMREKGLFMYVLACALAVSLQLYGVGANEVMGKLGEERLSAFEQNANALGAIYAVGFLIASHQSVEFFTKKIRIIGVIFFLGVTALCMIGVLLTASRGALLVCILGLIIRFVPAKSFSTFILNCLYLSFACGLIFYGAMQYPSIQNRIEDSYKHGVKDEGRVQHFPFLVDFFLDSPLWGGGPEKYRFSPSQRINISGKGYQPGITAHNSIMLVAVEMGLIGLIPFGYALWRLIATAWRLRRTDNLLPLAIVLPVVFIGLTVGNIIFHWHFYFAVAYILALGESRSQKINQNGL